MSSHEIAKIVHDCRKFSGLTQKELAQLADVGKTAVFDIEKGKETIQFNTLLKVLAVLNIKITFEIPFVQDNDS